MRKTARILFLSAMILCLVTGCAQAPSFYGTYTIDALLYLLPTSIATKEEHEAMLRGGTVMIEKGEFVFPTEGGTVTHKPVSYTEDKVNDTVRSEMLLALNMTNEEMVSQMNTRYTVMGQDGPALFYILETTDGLWAAHYQEEDSIETIIYMYRLAPQ